MKKLVLLSVIILFVSCEKQEVKPNYTNFKILSVTISALPFQDDIGTNWDLFDGPDIFFNMENKASAVLYNGSGARFKDIANTDLPLIWDFLTAYQITNLGVTHYVTVYDYDSADPNDLVGYIGFTMNDHKNGYPKTITKKSGTLTVSITGEWY